MADDDVVLVLRPVAGRQWEHLPPAQRLRAGLRLLLRRCGLRAVHVAMGSPRAIAAGSDDVSATCDPTTKTKRGAVE